MNKPLSELFNGEVSLKALEPAAVTNKGCIVRVTRSSYKRGARWISAVEVNELKSKSDLTIQDISDIESLDEIINLQDCKAGLYQLTACNISHDPESGIIDDWDVKLIPYTEPESNE